MLVAMGIAVVLLGGLGAVWWANVQANSVAVLVIKDPVQRGQIIQQQDLAEMEIVGGQSNGIPVDRTSEVVGKVAAVDLPAGAMLTDTSLDAHTTVPEGESLVGLSLEASQLPATELRSGDKIRIVATPLQQGEIPKEAPPTIEAVIYSTSTDARTGEQLLTVAVPSQIAPDLAAWAATNRIAVIADPANGGEGE